ncbi:MAG: alpha/beta fold hydrolase [Polyangiales bacterium]
MRAPTKLVFLPGAGGSPSFWAPVASRIAAPPRRALLGWPGFGDVPHDPSVRGLDDLVARVVAEIDQPCALIAHSMGGVVALRAALTAPERVTHLVLAVTSGGVDVRALGAADWRADFVASRPRAPRWFVDDRTDLSDALARVSAPTLLVWASNDPISPVAVGERLAASLPRASLRVVEGADHDVAVTHPDLVASWIDLHLHGDP